METHDAGAANDRSEGGRGESGPTPGERFEQVNDTAQEAWSRTRDAVDDLKRAADIQGRVDRHPYGSMAAALGIGYVLGGGIFTPLTSRIVGLGLRIGVRLALLPMLREEIGALADAITGEPPVERKGPGKGPDRKAAKAESEL